VRHYQKRIYIGLHVKYPLLLPDISQTGTSSQIFEKSSDIKFHRNPSSRSQVVPPRKADGWTDRHDKAKGCFAQFCEHA